MVEDDRLGTGAAQAEDPEAEEGGHPGARRGQAPEIVALVMAVIMPWIALMMGNAASGLSVDGSRRLGRVNRSPELAGGGYTDIVGDSGYLGHRGD